MRNPYALRWWQQVIFLACAAVVMAGAEALLQLAVYGRVNW